MNGFISFIRKQGVVGLAVGFILGGAISRVVTSIVNDLVNPIVGLLLGSAKGLEQLIIPLGTAQIQIGHFLSVLLDFTVISLVVYLTVHILKFDRLDKKEEAVPVKVLSASKRTAKKKKN